MKYAILTHDFRVLTVEQGTILQRHPEAGIDLTKLVCVTRIGLAASFTTSGAGDDWFDFDTARFGRATPGGFIELIAEPSMQGTLIRYDGRYLRADPNYIVDFVTQLPQLWETFRLVPLETFGRLLKIVTMAWAIGGEDGVHRFDVRASDFRSLALGRGRVDLDSLLIAAERSGPMPTSFLFSDDDKVSKAMLVRPVIVFAVFGYGESRTDFEISMASLAMQGHYTGDIVVVTDLPADHIRALAGLELAPRIRVIAASAGDQPAVSLSLLNTDLFDAYQPVIFATSDVVFDRPMATFLSGAAWCLQCSHDAGPERDGTQPGLLMIPNMARHGDNIRAALRSIWQREPSPGFGVDLEKLCDVLHRMHDLSADPLSAHRSPETPGSAPKGFRRFPQEAGRAQAMRTYLDTLRGQT